MTVSKSSRPAARAATTSQPATPPTMIALLSYRSRIKQRRRRALLAGVAFLIIAAAGFYGWHDSNAGLDATQARFSPALPMSDEAAGRPAVEVRAQPIVQDKAAISYADEANSKGIELAANEAELIDTAGSETSVAPVARQLAKLEIRVEDASESKPLSPVSAAAASTATAPTLPAEGRKTFENATALAKAEDAARAGNLGAALAAYEEILAAAPGDAAAVAGKVRSLTAGGQYAVATRFAESWLAHNALDYGVRSAYAAALARISDPMAEEKLRGLIAATPDFAPAKTALIEWQARFANTP